MPDKKKILLISDHPLVPSGVGTQARYLVEGLWKTGKYKFICLGGAVQHPDMRPQKVEPEVYGDDWIILPVVGYGDPQIIRRILATERPDALVFITDPRFYVWLWEMEDEVRRVCPMIYWHVWDNDPTPTYNRVFYDSTDHIAAISLKTKGILDDMRYLDSTYIPHGVDEKVFRPLPEAEVAEFKKNTYGPHQDSKFIAFWNNRNARRKVTGDVIGAFAKFAKEVGEENVSLMMHTAPHDPEGQDVFAVATMYGVEKRLIISDGRLQSEDLNKYYNVADCTINLASNEGFGLATMESLFCGTPIIAHFTGGLQFQLGDWWQREDGRLKAPITDQDRMTAMAKKTYAAGQGKWWGIPVFPAARSCTGSQQIPFIYDDRVNHDDVVKGLLKLYRMGRQGRKDLGLKAREWAIKNFNLDQMVGDFDLTIEKTLKKFSESPPPRSRVATL